MTIDNFNDLETIEALGNQPLLDFLVGNLTWPVLEGTTWEAISYDEIGTLATLKGDYNNDVLLDFYVSTDDKNSSVYVLKVIHNFLGYYSRF